MHMRCLFWVSCISRDAFRFICLQIKIYVQKRFKNLHMNNYVKYEKNLLDKIAFNQTI